jgi:hypothetical protein
LSFTIASQTIASSPDGSEMSSTAKSACDTPAATVGGGGCRFRASSTVTSSSSPCDNTSGHSRMRARFVLCTSGSGILLEHPGEHRGVSSVECRLMYPNVCPVMLCARSVAAVHAHRQAQRQVCDGFLGLSN